MTRAKKGLGRGLSALIPDSDMEFLSRVARDDTPVEVAPRSGTSRTHTGKLSGAGSHQSAPKAEAALLDSVDKPVLDLKEIDRQSTRRHADRAASPSSARSSLGQPYNGTTAGTKSTVPEAGRNLVEKTESNDVAEVDSVSNAAVKDDAQNVTSIEWIPMSDVEPNPYQPRRTFSRDEMNDLVSSIKNHGVLQPILVRPLSSQEGSQRFQLIAGERRWRAAQEAGLPRIPAICRPVSDRQALELAVIENVQRHDISAIDAALAYRRLADEFELSQESIARRVGKSRSSIANTMRLLDLPEEVKKTIEDGTLSEGHGRAILLAPGEGARRAVFRRVLRDKLSVREAERIAQGSSEITFSPPSESEHTPSDDNSESRNEAQKARENDLKQMTLKLQKALGTRLRLAPRGQGGRIIIDYASADELERLVLAFCH